ncbi:MAG TPA: four-carbon acid sugar kinase family protein [Bacteroidales bacterium]|nr:four-carbon acid sugar kinase family protein [Bacteroidales bacterium]
MIMHSTGNKEKILIVADDLTGASDTVVQFSNQGVRCMVIVAGNAAKSIDSCDVLAVDTESRFDDKETAYNKVYRTGRSLSKKNIKLVYKKIDSTMRGNPGAEISALMDSMNISHAIIAPALPVYGRTTVDGKVHVNNVLLENTEFSHDPVNPVRTSFIPGIISAQTDKKTGQVLLSDLEKGKDHLMKRIVDLFDGGAEMIIVDSRTNSDLDFIASCIEELNFPVIYAGCSGLATSLGKMISLKQENRISIVIAGSASAATRRQLDYTAGKLPVILIDVDTEKIINGKSRQEAEQICRQVKNASLMNKDVIIRTAPDSMSVDNTFRTGSLRGMTGFKVSERISTFLGRLVRYILEDVNVRGLLFTGGDTAIKAFRSLGVRGTVIKGEIDEGIPYGYFDDERYNDIMIVSKAGGFGNENAVVKILEFIKEKR